jgi:hypothetical protein
MKLMRSALQDNQDAMAAMLAQQELDKAPPPPDVKGQWYMKAEIFTERGQAQVATAAAVERDEDPTKRSPFWDEIKGKCWKNIAHQTGQIDAMTGLVHESCAGKTSTYENKGQLCRIAHDNDPMNLSSGAKILCGELLGQFKRAEKSKNDKWRDESNKKAAAAAAAEKERLKDAKGAGKGGPRVAGNKPCKYYLGKNGCQKGDACTFSHENKGDSAGNNGKENLGPYCELCWEADNSCNGRGQGHNTAGCPRNDAIDYWCTTCYIKGHCQTKCRFELEVPSHEAKSRFVQKHNRNYNVPPTDATFVAEFEQQKRANRTVAAK